MTSISEVRLQAQRAGFVAEWNDPGDGRLRITLSKDNFFKMVIGSYAAQCFLDGYEASVRILPREITPEWVSLHFKDQIAAIFDNLVEKSTRSQDKLRYHEVARLVRDGQPRAARFAYRKVGFFASTYLTPEVCGPLKRHVAVYFNFDW